MRKIIIIVFFFSLPAAFLFAEDTVKIAAIFSITGEASSTADEHLVTVRFAVDEINRKGGVLGKKIELLEYDNESSPLGARYAARKAVKEDIAAAFTGSWSSYVLAMAPVFQEAGIPMLTPIATNPDVTKAGNYIFRVCFVDSFQGEAMSRFAYNDLNARKAAVLTNSDQIFSIGLSEQFKKSFTDLGGEITLVQKYIENMSDYDSIASMINNDNCDVIFLPGYSRDSAQIIKNARRLGITRVFLGGDGWSSLMFNYAPDSLENNYYITHWHKSLEDKKTREFVMKIATIFPDDRINAGMALSYDMVYLLADAIERAGSFDREKIREAVENTRDFTGTTGRIVFDSNGDPVKPAVIIRFSGGKSEFVRQIE